MRDENHSLRLLVGSGYQEVIEVARSVAEGWQETNGQITPEIASALDRIVFLFAQIERKPASVGRSLVTTERERGT